MDTKTTRVDTGPVGTVVAGSAVLGADVRDLGRVSALSADQIEMAWAKAVEILGPGTVTRDQVKAIVLAAFARRT